MNYTQAEWNYMRQRTPRTFARLWADYQDFERRQRLERQRKEQRKSRAPKRRRHLVKWFNRARHRDVQMLRYQYWKPHPNPRAIVPVPYVTRMDIIRRKVSELSGFTLDELASRRKETALVHARQAAFYLAKIHTNLSLPAIGRYFGRDHTTVLHGIRQVEKNPSRFAKYKPLEAHLKATGE